MALIQYAQIRTGDQQGFLLDDGMADTLVASIVCHFSERLYLTTASVEPQNPRAGRPIQWCCATPSCNRRRLSDHIGCFPMIGRTVNGCFKQPIGDRISLPESGLRPGQEPALGSHLVTRRTFYSHHGIYVGGGRVIHYAGFAHGLRRGPVEEVSLEHFAHGHAIRLRDDGPSFDRREVVQRARSRLGECRYDILRNNCEHFCTWALRGETRSRQVEWLRSVPRVLYGWIEQLPLGIARLRQGTSGAAGARPATVV
jgi:hypothetical protein